MNNENENTIVAKRRGRPLGSKNSTSVEEHNQRMIQRKKNLAINFQKYKEQNHEELKKVYLEHYEKNKEKKLARMKQLYGLKCCIKQFMAIDESIFVF